MAETQKKLQALTEEYQKLQTDLEGFVDARQKLESQQQENQGVQSEFAALDDEANIYKLVGPVLLKQDRNEAVMAVDGRLEFIEKEIWLVTHQANSKRIEGQIQETEDKSDKKRTEIVQFQTQIQQQQQQQEQQAAAAASA